MATLPEPVKMCEHGKNKRSRGKGGKTRKGKETRAITNNSLKDDSSKSNKEGKHEYHDGKKAVFNLGFGDSYYIPNFIESKKEQKQIFKSLLNEIEFEQMFNVTHKSSQLNPIPRLVIAQTYKENFDESPIYRMPGCNERNIGTIEWTPTVSKLRDEASKYMKQEINHCVCTLYRNGKDSLGFHKDKLIDLKDDTKILSLSFGSPRILEFRKITRKYTVKQAIMLQAGSLLAIGHKTNKMFEHSIIKMENESIGPRISLSMRTIDTFKKLESNEIIGKGKQWQTNNYPFTKSYDNWESYSDEMKQEYETWKQTTKDYLQNLRAQIIQSQTPNQKEDECETLTDSARESDSKTDSE